MVAIAVGTVSESSTFKKGGGIDAALDMSAAVKAESVVLFAAAAFLLGFFLLAEILVASGDRGVTTGRWCSCCRCASGQETVGN